MLFWRKNTFTLEESVKHLNLFTLIKNTFRISDLGPDVELQYLLDGGLKCVHITEFGKLLRSKSSRCSKTFFTLFVIRSSFFRHLGAAEQDENNTDVLSLYKSIKYSKKGKTRHINTMPCSIYECPVHNLVQQHTHHYTLTRPKAHCISSTNFHWKTSTFLSKENIFLNRRVQM